MQRLGQFWLSRFSGWRGLVWPGLLMILLTCLLRLAGLLQMQEWMALDAFSRRCPAIAPPERLTIVSIDETDYRRAGEFPLSDGVLLQMLEALQAYEPRVVGLNLLNAFSEAASADAALQDRVRAMPNLVLAERAFASEMTVAPLVNLPAERVGFIDSMVDSDGELRRAILAARGEDGGLKYSLAMQVVRRYLQDEKIAFEVGADGDVETIRLGGVELARLYANSGGYVRANTGVGTGEYQSLIHFCALQRPFETVSLRDLLAGQADEGRLRDRIVLVGNITTSLKDSFITSAVRETLYSQQIAGASTDAKLIYGVEIQGLMAKQLLSSAIDRPCMLQVWLDPVEYLWIAGWGLLGIVVCVLLKSAWKSVLALAGLTAVVVGLSYWLLTVDWWVPVVPAVLALGGAGLVTAFLDWDMRFELAQRKLMVERAYQAVHNGPLQRLAVLLRSAQTFSLEQMETQLQVLNVEMRDTFEYMRREADAGGYSLHFADEMLDLRQPLAVLLYQVYDATLEQDLPGFRSVRSYIAPSFECVSRGRFSLEQKRGLCLFLQEALVNVGKYAIGATRIDVVCAEEEGRYRLKVMDNAPGVRDERDVKVMSIGEGTRQAIALARRLGGEFRRLPNLPQGTICELVWPKR